MVTGAETIFLNGNESQNFRTSAGPRLKLKLFFRAGQRRNATPRPSPPVRLRHPLAVGSRLWPLGNHLFSRRSPWRSGPSALSQPAAVGTLNRWVL